MSTFLISLLIPLIVVLWIFFKHLSARFISEILDFVYVLALIRLS